MYQIEITYGHVQHSDALEAHIKSQVEHAMRHTAERFTRIEVHLHDDNAGKSGADDKRCVIEARPRGADPLAVSDTGADMYATIGTASKKLERAVKSWVDKRNDR